MGHGSYGQVYSGIDTVDNAKVAVKCIQDVFRTTEDAKRTLVRPAVTYLPCALAVARPQSPPHPVSDPAATSVYAMQREICILRQCRHPNVISCRSVLRPPDPSRFEHIWIVLEMCDWDLRKVMNTRMKQWTFEHVKRLMHQTLCGLAYLHGAKVVHRDLKPANVMLNRRGEVKISDFGISSQLENTAALCETFIGKSIGGSESCLLLNPLCWLPVSPPIRATSAFHSCACRALSYLDVHVV